MERKRQRKEQTKLLITLSHEITWNKKTKQMGEIINAHSISINYEAIQVSKTLNLEFLILVRNEVSNSPK